MDQDTHITTSQSVRYRDIIAQFEIVTLNGIECLFLEDVRQRFPSVTCLCIDNIQLSFLQDENGNRLEPQRIKPSKDKIIDALDPEGHSHDDICARFDRLDERTHAIQKSIDLIQTNTQESLIKIKQTMVQMYELHEYTTPRYFYIVPDGKYDRRGMIDILKDLFRLQYKLYFFCECSDDPNHFHVALHQGYLISKPKEFIATYGDYIRKMLDIARAVLNVTSSIIPQYEDTPECVNDTYIPSFDQSDIISYKHKLDIIEELLDQSERSTTSTDISVTTTQKASQRIPVQGAQLRELGNYLENVDKNNSLGNLYRKITDDGHVRWVCLEHYDTVFFNNKMAEYIHEFEAIGGKFDQNNKKAIISGTDLTSDNIKSLCSLLMKCFNNVALQLENCSLLEIDLDKLLDIIINRHSISCLKLSTVKIRIGRGEPKYTCNDMFVRFKNQSLEIQLPGHYQIGDIRLFNRLWWQNKIYRVVHFRGCSHFPEYEETFLDSGSQIKQEAKALIVNQLHNIDFVNDILERDLSLSQLKLNSCFSSIPVLSRFCRILGKNETLVELDIMSYTSFDDELFISKILKLLRTHKSLKKLSLLISNLKPSDTKEVHLIDSLKKDSFIFRLRLLDSNISHELTEAFVEASQNRHSLTHLELYNYQMNDEDMLTLKSLLTDGHLTHLTLSNEQYWCVMLQEIQQQYQKEFNQYENLKLREDIQHTEENQFTIDLDEQQLTDRDIQIVVNDAIIDKQCKRLSLSKNKITLVGTCILANALHNNTTLTALNIAKNHLCDIGLYYLTKTLTINNRTLTELNLSSNEITDEGIKHLVHMLETNKILIELYLSKNKITHIGVQILADVIQNDKNVIEKLWLSGNKLTDSSVIHIIRMIKQKSSLKKLFVLDCDFSDRCKKQLKKIADQSKQTFELNI